MKAERRMTDAAAEATRAPQPGTLRTMPADLPEPRLTANARKVLANRYLKKDRLTGEVIETPKELFWRVASAVAAPEYERDPEVGECWARRFYELMARGVFMPNSPTLMNAGRQMGMLSACFVLPVEDSIEGIFTTLKHVALIQKAGGGTGFSFSRLRPDGDIVASSGGQTSGPLSFIDAYSAGTDAIQQGAFRRGANMGVLRCDHPDVVEFIRAKDDLTRWTNYNVSVAVTEEWMNKVIDHPEDPLVVVNPRNGQKGWLRKVETGRRVSLPDYEAYAAGAPDADAEYWTYGEVLDLVVFYAWKNGEPGMLFLDRANQDNPVPHLGDYEATNPCVTADTWVLTAGGPRQVRELLDRPVDLVVDGCAWPSGPAGFFRTGRKPVLELRTREGMRLRLTADHPVRKVVERSRWRLETAWEQVGSLQPGDEIVLHDHRALAGWQGSGSAAEGYLLGLLLGDGTLKQEAAVLSVWARPTADGTLPSGPLAVRRAAGECAMELGHRADFQGFHEVAGRNEWRLQSAPLRDLAARMGMVPGAKHIGPEVERSSSAFYRAFLRGLFDADGSVQGNHEKGVSVRLAQSHRGDLEAVQRMLLRLGVVSSIHRRRAAGESLLPDGRGGMATYPVREQFELIIANDNLHRFVEVVGFTDTDKQARLESLLAGYRRRPNRELFLARVEAIEPAGEEEVFDVQVPGVHAFDANGLYVHNCGEQWLLPYSSCNLGSINLGAFFRPDAPETARWQDRFDGKAFDEVVAESVRFLDNVVTINRFPIPEIRERADQERRIGLGVMGFADLLYRLGIRYGSEESFAVARELSKRLTEVATRASERMVAEEGFEPFQVWEGSKPQQEGRPPRRNATLTTVAPTGTISIIAGCSGGIEPLFSLAFKRQVMKDAEGNPVVMKEVNEDFRLALEKSGYSEAEIDAVVDVALQEGTIASTDLPRDLKDVFVTARDVEPREHILMQAAWQTHIDNAVSKTINLPRESTEEDVRTAYLLAWREGCKGITVYRDGSREMQPMALEEKQKKGTAGPAAQHEFRPAKLPEIMPCVRVRQMTPFGNLHAKISVDPVNEREVEVFAQLGKGGDVANSDLEAICRMISLFLRCGGQFELVLKQLEGIGSSLTVPSKDGRIMSLADGLAKALSKYLYAKSQFGLRAILLGEVDPEALAQAHGGNGAGPDADAPRPRMGKIGTGMAGAFKVKCPACSSELAFEEGCCKCYDCGFSQC